MMRLSEAATLLGGQASGGDVLFTGVSTDTRTLRPGDLFVALRGERLDGHRFLPQARAAGAVAAMVDEAAALPPEHDLPLLGVRGHAPRSRAARRVTGARISPYRSSRSPAAAAKRR